MKMNKKDIQIVNNKREKEKSEESINGVLIGINKFEYGNNLKDIFSEFNNENTLFFDVEENIIINNYHNIIYENKATPQSYFHKMEKLIQ